MADRARRLSTAGEPVRRRDAGTGGRRSAAQSSRRKVPAQFSPDQVRRFRALGATISKRDIADLTTYRACHPGHRRRRTHKWVDDQAPVPASPHWPARAKTGRRRRRWFSGSALRARVARPAQAPVHGVFPQACSVGGSKGTNVAAPAKRTQGPGRRQFGQASKKKVQSRQPSPRLRFLDNLRSALPGPRLRSAVRLVRQAIQGGL